MTIDLLSEHNPVLNEYNRTLNERFIARINRNYCPDIKILDGPSGYVYGQIVSVHSRRSSRGFEVRKSSLCEDLDLLLEDAAFQLNNFLYYGKFSVFAFYKCHLVFAREKTGSIDDIFTAYIDPESFELSMQYCKVSAVMSLRYWHPQITTSTET